MRAEEAEAALPAVAMPALEGAVAEVPDLPEGREGRPEAEERTARLPAPEPVPENAVAAVPASKLPLPGLELAALPRDVDVALLEPAPALGPPYPLLLVPAPSGAGASMSTPRAAA